MGGLDVEVLTAGSDAHQTGWNLSSQGQGLLESLFIVDQLDAGVETLVLPVEIRSIQDVEYTIPSSKVYAYELYGYDFSPVLGETIRNVADQATQDVFFDSWIEKRLGARSAIRAGIDTAIVEFFTGTDVSEGDEDIYFPTPYENRLSVAGLEARLERNHVERVSLPTELPRPFVDLLKTYQSWGEEQDVEVVLLVLPEHPNQQSLSPDGYYDALEELFQAEADARGFELLFPAEMFSEPDYFVDHIHLHTSGAAELTNFVMSEIG